ncbi:MAG TPA: FUSC family protein [Xanthobacteraceae bacterium]|nr:FUSC family protein [Xanthobacteraceae bacterium]
MTRNTGPWQRLRAVVLHHRVQLALSVRMTIAALASYLLAQALQLPLPLWAVLTAVIVTQMSVGRSLKATFDYLAGTIGGAIYGGAIGVLISYTNEAALLAGLAVAVAPLALIAAINPRFSVAPITAIIVVLIPTMTHATAISSAIDRVTEVALGGFTGFFVSFLLLPANAHPLVAAAAARTLEQMARALAALLAGLRDGLDVDALHRIQDGIGQALEQLNVIGDEAERERAARLAAGADTGPLLRTLLRLRHDLVMVGRAALNPLPDAVRTRLEVPLTHVGAAFDQYLRASAAALRAGAQQPSLDAMESALEAYAAEVAALRRDGVTRTLTDDAAERFFALGFALEQMHANCTDLGRVVAEWAEPAKEAGRGKAQPD